MILMAVRIYKIIGGEGGMVLAGHRRVTLVWGKGVSCVIGPGGKETYLSGLGIVFCLHIYVGDSARLGTQ